MATLSRDSLSNHSVLLASHIGLARRPQVEEDRWIDPLGRFPEVPGQQAADVLGHGDTELSGPLTGFALHLTIESDLGPRHHDVAIIARSLLPTDPRIKLTLAHLFGLDPTLNQ